MAKSDPLNSLRPPESKLGFQFLPEPAKSVVKETSKKLTFVQHFQVEYNQNVSTTLPIFIQFS